MSNRGGVFAAYGDATNGSPDRGINVAGKSVKHTDQVAQSGAIFQLLLIIRLDDQ